MSCKRGYILGILVLLFSCNEKLIKEPEDLIAKEKMVEVLRDMAIANAARSTNIALLRKNDIEPSDFVLKKHGIDSAQFAESDRYYASTPVIYEALFAQVEERLEKEFELMETARKLNDSLAAEERKKKEGIKTQKKQVNDSLP